MKGVMYLNPRERIRAIRLTEKLEKHPTYAKALGIEAAGAAKNENTETAPKGLTNA